MRETEDLTEILTTAKSPTTAGLNALSECLRGIVKDGKYDKAEFEKKAAEIRKKYGEALSDGEVATIARMESEQAECETCKGYPCQKAWNKGYKPVLRKEKDWGQLITLERCKPYEIYLRQAELLKKFRYSKIPVRFKGKTFADYRADDQNRGAVDFAKTIMLEGYSGAYFYGDVGTGKTFLAALIAREFLKAGKSVLFEKVTDLLTEFYAVYRGQGGSEDELLSELYNVDLLVLDDFGIEKPTQFVGATLCKILDARYNREDVATIITSNYSLEQIKVRLNNPVDMQAGDMCLNGSRIYDRCIEICKPILFKGNSRRR